MEQFPTKLLGTANLCGFSVLRSSPISYKQPRGLDFGVETECASGGSGKGHNKPNPGATFSPCPLKQLSFYWAWRCVACSNTEL